MEPFKNIPPQQQPVVEMFLSVIKGLERKWKRRESLDLPWYVNVKQGPYKIDTYSAFEISYFFGLKLSAPLSHPSLLRIVGVKVQENNFPASTGTHLKWPAPTPEKDREVAYLFMRAGPSIQ